MPTSEFSSHESTHMKQCLRRLQDQNSAREKGQLPTDLTYILNGFNEPKNASVLYSAVTEQVANGVVEDMYMSLPGNDSPVYISRSQEKKRSSELAKL